MDDIFNVSEIVTPDQSIEKIDYHSYTPYNLLTLNNSDEIRICINNQDLITLPSKSFLYITGEVTNNAKCTIIRNGFAHLFSELRYEIASNEIEYVKNVGVTSSIKGLISLTPTESKRFMFQTIQPDSKFSICLPLSILTGFFEDFTKVLINVKQELILKRSNTDLNVFKQGAITLGEKDCAIAVKSIEWYMPHITPSDIEKLSINKILDRNKMIPIAFRQWELHELPSFPHTTRHTWNIKTANSLQRPRYIVFGFKTDKDNKKSEDMFSFDNCNLKNLKVYLNSDYYPYNDLKLDFANSKNAILYEMYVKFQENYYNKTNGEPLLDSKEFFDNTPIVVVDTSMQSDRIKQSIVDIKLEIETSAAVPANTIAYCLILHDRLVEYNPFTNDVRK